MYTIKTNMTDIFDNKILCKNCNKEMFKTIVNRNGLELRAVECAKCKEKIIHPADLNGFEHFKDLKGKTFSVKLRMVGNSHAISIPKEILDFMNDQHRQMSKRMDDMVKLCFEDFDTLRLRFGDEENFDNNEYKENDDTDDDFNILRVRKLRRNNDGR